MPGSDERKLARALTSRADAVIADLEDAVAPAGKGAARELVTRMLAEPIRDCARIVRINGAVSLDGKLIDAPVVERARAILERGRSAEESR